MLFELCSEAFDCVGLYLLIGDHLKEAKAKALADVEAAEYKDMEADLVQTKS